MNRKTLFLLLTVTLALPAAASPTPSPTPRPRARRTWVDTGQRNVSVKVDPIKKGIDVTLRKNNNAEMPRSIGVTLTDSTGKQTTMELQAIPPEPPVVRYHGDLSGSLSGSGQSIMGFELRIPFGSGPAKVLRSEDMEETQ